MTLVQVKLRIPAKMKSRLQRHAKRNDRSVSAEIGQRLQRSFDNEALAQVIFEKMKERLDVTQS